MIYIDRDYFTLDFEYDTIYVNGPNANGVGPRQLIDIMGISVILALYNAPILSFLKAKKAL